VRRSALTATLAENPQEAAQVYPGNYWLSLLEPRRRAIPRDGPVGNGIGTTMLTQNHYINSLKSDCNFCHQLGNKLTRSVDHVLKASPNSRRTRKRGVAARHRVRGSRCTACSRRRQGSAAKTYAGWTERMPAEKCRRPAAAQRRPSAMSS